MPRKLLWLAGIMVALLGMAGHPQRASATTAMIFCNGDMGSASGLTTSQINGLRASGFTTMVLFTMSVQTNGDFTFSDGSTVCSGGVYVGPSNWASLINQCRAAQTSINRIEMCIAQWGDTSFRNIKNRIAADGTGSGTVLYRNLQALKSALGIDAIDYDDETIYDASSAISFGQMCGAVGMKVSLCPYTNPGYWQAVKAGLGSTCDQVYLQCYDGGAGNNPTTWNSYFGGLKVIPGYWDYERDSTFLNNMQAWKSAGGNGGFLWPSCTGCNPPADSNEMTQYAHQILNTFNPVVNPVTAADVVGSQVTFSAAFVGSNLTYQWQMIRGGATNNIPGATNTTLTLSNLQLTNTASYQLQASNAAGIVTSTSGSLTVSSVPAAVNNVITSYAAQTGLGFGFSLTPSWTVAPGSLIYGQFPSSTNGDFDLEPNWGDRNVNSLTSGDGLRITPGGNPITTSTNYVTCGNGGSPAAGASVIYTLTGSAGGCNLTNITVYGGWRDGGRDQQAYTVYYSKTTAPATFILLGSVNYNPANAANVPSATRAILRAANGWLATNVAAVKFDFTSPASENGFCGYANIGLFGIPLGPVVVMNTLPVTAADVVGSQVAFTAAFTAASPPAYQWRVISGGTTNDIPGATNTTLALTNLQLTNTAAYQLQASNAYGVALSSPGSLTVSSMPAAVNNVVTSMAAQTGLGNGTAFTPTWTFTTNDNLIAGQLPSNTSGNFSMEVPGRSVNSLTVGGSDSLTQIAASVGYTTSTNYVTCGNGGGAGSSVTYTLTGSASGFNLTNIMVYGGWVDAGRDQQAYTVYYSTMAAPTTFYLLGSVNYNPSNPANVQSATRATLRPSTGALATNVAAVKFDLSNPASENGFCGYSQIALFGTPTQVVVPPATNPTNLSFEVSANSLLINWSSDHTGWRLQCQTNNLDVGIGTNWFDVAGSTITNQMSLPLNPGNGSVFYRLLYP
ncbi:hypothetical protein [Pedosphaera parvula]|nr:hypothetical protein [Pedosphaera parvula]